MSDAQLLEVEVGRVIRYAASRSSWTLIPVMPNLFRISQKLEDLMRDVETAEVRPAPDDLNRLSRAIHALRKPFSSPLFHVIIDRIEYFNLQLAGYAENLFMAGRPEFQNVVAETALRVGPISENSALFEPVLRSA